MIVLAGNDLLEALDGVFQLNVHAWSTGESFGNMERLGEETLDLPCPGDDQFIIFGKLIHTENGDDILQILIALQNILNRTGNSIVLFADDIADQESVKLNQAGQQPGRYRARRSAGKELLSRQGGRKRLPEQGR